MNQADENRLLSDAIDYGLFDDVEPDREKLKKAAGGSTLIAEVQRLREMEQQATPRGWTCKSAGNQMDYEIRGEPELYILFQDSDINDPRFITDMRNAAPDLLAVLSGFQPGDADEIDYAIQVLERLFGPENVSETTETLRRLLAMARKMEAEK